MSMEPSSLPARADSSTPACPEPGDAATGIRRQAAAIIDAVLSAPAPEGAGIRERLREHLAAHPGRPETALAEHLMALRSLTRDPAETSMAVPAAAGAPGQPQARTLEPEARALRIQAVLNGRMLLTAFQPIFELSTGSAASVEASTRFATDGSDDAGYWFAEAAGTHLGSELEFTALESALAAAQHLPPHLYVALKLSPATCLDPLLPGLLEESMLAPDRMVLELTEALTEEQPAALTPCDSAESGSRSTIRARTSARSATSGSSNQTSSNWTATSSPESTRTPSAMPLARPWSASRNSSEQRSSPKASKPMTNWRRSPLSALQPSKATSSAGPRPAPRTGPAGTSLLQPKPGPTTLPNGINLVLTPIP